jgi:hypothetical protein
VRWAELSGDCAAEAVARFARRPFDLTEDAVLRAGIRHEAPDRAVVALCVHHIACDGVALQLLCAEWAARYAGVAVAPSDGYRAALAARSGPPDPALVAFWQREIGDPAPPLVTDDQPVPATGRPAGTQVRTVPASRGDAVTAAARTAGLTPHMMLVAAFAAVLATEFDRTDITIGTPVTGRGPRETAIIGCFAGILPLRIRHVEPSLSPSLLAQVREVCLTAYAHQGMPAEAIAELRGGRPRPLTEAALGLLTGPRHPLPLPGVRVEPVHVDLGSVQLPLDLDVTWDDGLALELRHDLDRVPDHQAARVLDRLVEVLS